MKKNLTFLIFLQVFIFMQATAFSSLVWDLNSGINEYGKNPNSAIDYFKYYINANPNDPQGYWWLGMSYLKSGDKLSAQKTMLHAYKKSYDYFNIERIELPEDEYDNLEDYFDMASMCFEQGNLKEADTYVDMMLKIDPDSSSAYFMKAKIALSMGKAQKAHEYMEHAVILNSSLLNTNLAKN